MLNRLLTARALKAARIVSLIAGFLHPAAPVLVSGADFAEAPRRGTEAPPANEQAASGADHEAILLSAARQVTFEGRRAGEGYFSADGKMMVFQSEREPGNPFYQIYLLDLETGDTRRISPGHGKTTCAWIHPGDGKVLFASTHHDPEALAKQRAELEERATGAARRYSWDYDESYEIYEADIRSGELTRLTSARGYDAECSWSPDGRKILFASNRHAYSEELSKEDADRFARDPSFLVDIYIMDAGGTGVRRLTRSRGYDGGPFFSPDGRRICWRRFSEDGATAEIFTMGAGGGDERRITHLDAMSWAPYYHPSGAYLIFTTNLHGFANFELYIADVRGERQPVRVTTTDGFDGLPVFTPDGSELYWTSTRTPEKQAQIFAAGWNHREALRLLRASPLSAPVTASAPAAAGRPGTAGTAPATATAPAAETRPTVPEIRAADLRIHVEALASEEMEGRLTGTRGEELATAYVADWFRRVGIEPAGDGETYFQEFSFTAGVALGDGSSLALHREGDAAPRPLEIDADWRPLSFSAAGSFDPAEVVFAGYGFSAPRTGDFDPYDSFVHLPVKDRWVLALRYLPERVEPERRQHLARFTSLRYKAMLARDKGARGLILASGPASNVKEQLVPLRFDASLAGTSIPVISITDEAAERLLEGSGRTLEDLQDELDSGEPKMGFVLDGVKVAARVDLEKVRRTGRNVLGVLRAGAEASSPPILVIGAHVDHLGKGLESSLARDEERGGIHHGADDNASGVAAVIEIAEKLAADRAAGRLPLRRDILFAAWSGEELGLLGSRHYVESLSKALGDPEHLRSAVAACLNLDMVGRLRKSLILQGAGSSSIWRREIEQRNAVVGLPLSLSEESYLPTDTTSFHLRGVPSLSAFTGAHEEYHTPRDTPDRLDYEGLERISRLFHLLARGLALREEAPDYTAVEGPRERGSRAGLRAYLGTIPDYGESPAPGVKLSGVSKGAPAETAGLRGGDLIVELAGRKIENIYDYTYAIEALKIGETVEITVIRGGERKTLEITPGSRE